MQPVVTSPRQSGKLEKRAFAGYAAFVLSATWFSACSRKPAAGDEDESAKPEAVVAEVTLTRVKRTAISRTLSVTGTTAALPNEDVRVSALVAGRIASMLVSEGDRVARGQWLAQSADRPYPATAAQAGPAPDQTNAT